MDGKIIAIILLSLLVIVLTGILIYMATSNNTNCSLNVPPYSALSSASTPLLADGSNYTDSEQQNLIQSKNAIGWVVKNNYTQKSGLRMYYYNSSGNLHYQSTIQLAIGGALNWTYNDQMVVYPGLNISCGAATDSGSMPTGNFVFQIPMNATPNNIIYITFNKDGTISGSIC